MKKETPPSLPLSGEEPREAPYPGLRPYREDERGKFFGRESDAEVLIDKVLTNRLTLLFAASGVGKSSLLQAAVIPRLKSPTGENLEVVYHIDWVSEPVSSVRAAVLQALHTSGKLPEGAAEEAGETLAELLEFCGLFVRHPLVLILDQFEEFFRYQRATASFQPFIEQLTAVITNPQLPVSLVLSMREDFALELNAFKPRLPTILFENFYRLEKLGRVGAREAIVTPVEQVDFHYEPVLLETLLDDLLSRELDRLPHSPVVELLETVEPPYLQIVCAQLWELNKADPDKLLRLTTYEKAGNAKGILSNYLTGVLQTFTLAEKQLASKAFDHLASQRGVKMAYTAAALAETVRVNESALGKVLEKLTAVRILRSQQRSDATWYELYHDMFSGSIENWNGAWKNKMRRRKFAQVAIAGFVSIATLFAGWDYYVNATSYHLRLSPKQGVSDQVELWQGKRDAIDLFHKQHFLAETDFERYELEPDKQFNSKVVNDYDDLYMELTANLPIDQRIIAYAHGGYYKDSVNLAKKSIFPENLGLARRVISSFASVSIKESIELIYEIFHKTSSDGIKEIVTGNNSMDAYSSDMTIKFASGVLYEKALNENAEINFIDEEDFWGKQFIMQLSRKFAKDKLSDFSGNAVSSSLEYYPDQNSVIPFFTALTQSPDNYTRSDAWISLINLKAVSNDLLLTLLEDEDPSVALSATEALAMSKGISAIPNISRSMKNKNSSYKSEIIGILSRLKGKDIIPDIHEMLKNTNLDSNAEYELSKTLGLLGDDIHVNAIKEIIKRFSTGQASILDIPRSPVKLRKLLYDKDVQSTSAYILGYFGIKEAIPDLHSLLKDSNESMCASSIEALGKLNAVEATSDIREFLKSVSADVRSAAVNALAQMKITKSVPDFLTLLKDNDAKVRSAAINALAQMEIVSATPDLIPLLRDQNKTVKISVINALSSMNAIEQSPEFLHLLKDEDQDIKIAAAKALAKFNISEAIPYFAGVIADCRDGDSNCVSLTNSLNRLPMREVIPDFLVLLGGFYGNQRDLIINILAKVDYRHNLRPSAMPFIGSKLPSYNNGHYNPLLESYGYMASNEILDILLRRLRSGDQYLRESATVAAKRMECRGDINKIQKRLLNKALSFIDQGTLNRIALMGKNISCTGTQAIDLRRPITQPGLEEKPLTLDELKATLDSFDQAYADWRRLRDTEPVANTTTDTPTTDSETNKLTNPAPFIYEYAYAIANMDEAEGIKLLGHNLTKVREAAARGLANSNFLGVPLLQKLEQEWLATDNPITRQGLFHAIDIALLAMEGIGADKELEALKAYEPTLTNERSAASIKPRVEWTRIQLQWRVDALKELKELADRQLPGLLKEYCLNPDGTDMKPEECTIER